MYPIFDPHRFYRGQGRGTPTFSSSHIVCFLSRVQASIARNPRFHIENEKNGTTRTTLADYALIHRYLTVVSCVRVALLWHYYVLLRHYWSTYVLQSALLLQSKTTWIGRQKGNFCTLTDGQCPTKTICFGVSKRLFWLSQTVEDIITDGRRHRYWVADYVTWCIRSRSDSRASIGHSSVKVVPK